MKKRNGFVTNSSSSSFILSFKDENDYASFREYCEENDYISLFELIDGIKNEQENGLIDEDGDVLIEKESVEQIREKALKQMERIFTFDAVRNYLDDKLDGISDFKEKIKKEKEIKETEEFKQFYDSLFVKKDFNTELNKFIKEKSGNGLKRNNEFMKTYEYEEKRKELLANNRYFKGVERLKEAESIVMGTIWDTSGGLLEYAIRNGLLEKEFNQWLDGIWHVG